jgi:hypothetical protein
LIQKKEFSLKDRALLKMLLIYEMPDKYRRDVNIILIILLIIIPIDMAYFKRCKKNDDI